MPMIHPPSRAAVRALVLAALGAAAALVARPALPEPASAASGESGVLKLYDSNRDGTVSLQEWLEHGGSLRAFRAADANRDGRLDAAEVVKANSYNDRIKAAEFAGDAWTTAKVKAALLQDAAVSALDVDVHTRDGVVQLSGFVRSAQQATRAADIAAHVEGVRKVVNALIVKS